MHSPHQIHCLQELGINFLQLKDDFKKTQLNAPGDLLSSEVESSMELINWAEIEQCGLEDLKVLFPSLEVSGSIVTLAPTVSWQLAEIDNPEISQELITSNQPKFLSAQQKSAIWQALSVHVKADE